jgi:peroxiredoxin
MPATKQYIKQVIAIAAFYALALLRLAASTAGLTVISGAAPDYEGSEIVFYYKQDFITETPVEAARLVPGPGGEFYAELQLHETTQLYANLGVYKGTFYAQPGRSYQLALPPRREIGLLEELNPYFVRELVRLGIRNADENELNYLIYHFDLEYEAFIADYFHWIYITADRAIVDSFDLAAGRKYKREGDDFLNNYIEYKMAAARHLADERDIMFATFTYYLDKPFRLQNEAYTLLLNQLFTNYFTVNYASGIAAEVHSAVLYYKSPSVIKNVLDKRISFRNDTLKELLILRCLYDAFSAPEVYPRHTVAQTLDSLMLQTEIDYVRQAASNIKQATRRVLAGEKAPVLGGISASGDSLNLSMFHGKYVYLQFCRSENYACQKDYRLMRDIHLKTEGKDLAIITLSYDQSFTEFKTYLGRNQQLGWDFAFSANRDALEIFDVRAMPSYLLIDPDGHIALNPAPSPHQNFLGHFEMVLRFREAAKRMQPASQPKRNSW